MAIGGIAENEESGTARAVSSIMSDDQGANIRFINNS